MSNTDKIQERIDAWRQTLPEELDIHRALASYLFDVSYENVTKTQRQAAKVLFFRLHYGHRDPYSGRDPRGSGDVSEAADTLPSVPEGRRVFVDEAARVITSIASTFPKRERTRHLEQA